MNAASKVALALLLVVFAPAPFARAQGGDQKQRDPRAKALQESAHLLIQQGKGEEAIADLEKAIKLEPEWDLLYYRLGLMYSKKYVSTGDAAYEEKSLAAFRKCLDLNPSRDGVRLEMASMAFASGRYEEAIALAAREIAHNPSESSAYRVKWEAMLRRADFEKQATVIRGEIEALLRSKVDRERTMLAALSGYELLADPDARRGMEDLYLKEFPASPAARNILRDRALSEADKIKQAELMEDFITRFPADPFLENMYPLLFRSLAGRADEPGARIARVGEAWVKCATALYDLVTSRSLVALALAERRFDLGRAQSIADEAADLMDGLDTESPLLKGVPRNERGGLLSMLKTRAHAARGFALLRRGEIEEASKELRENLHPVIAQVEKNGYILWKDMDLREVGVRPYVLWLAELFEAQGDYERAARYLLAGFCDSERANNYIRERLPFVYEKMGRGSAAASSALAEAERRFRSLMAISPALKDEIKNRALAARVDKPAPDFNLTALDKRLLRLSDLRGRVIVLSFWATWCGPCVAELPHLQKAAERYKGNAEVVFLMVSTDRNKLAVRSFLERNGYTLPAAYDDGAAGRFGVSGIPATFIIDRAGVIQFREEGFGADGPGYVERMVWRVDELLKEGAGAK
jgi:cytochrome c biogenesis protein CcmG/thiol:disulfide interchange protein DsbE